MSESEWLREVAYHEAGHAVAAYFLDRPFNSVSIIPDDLTSGRVDGEGYEGRTKSIIRKEMIVLLAGDLAQRIATEDTDNFYDPTADFDLMQLEELAARAYKTPELRREFWSEVQKEAWELVASREWQAAIIAIAQSLLECKELNHEQSVNIIRMSQVEL